MGTSVWVHETRATIEPYSDTLEAVDTNDAAVMFLALGVGLSIIEIFAPGLVFLPFGLAAGVAAIAGFLGAPLLAQAIIFLVASIALFLALRPLSRRLNAADQDAGIGADRLIGATGIVLEDVHPQQVGLVRLDREEWRAESADDSLIVAGTQIVVNEVRGTRVLISRDTAVTGRGGLHS